MHKLSLIVLRQERTALADGRVVDAVSVNDKFGTDYRWQCICRPEDKHDHEPMIRALSAGITHRAEVLPPLAALVGKMVTVGGTTATIIDSNIQIVGPADWPLYLAWKYQDGRIEDRTIRAETPLHTPRAEAALEIVKAAVAKSEERAKAAIAHANFAGEDSGASQD